MSDILSYGWGGVRGNLFADISRVVTDGFRG